MTVPRRLKRWVAFGSGAGISIEGPRGSESLRVCAVRVRPAGARIVSSFTVEDFQRRPAAEWGAAYTAAFGKLGLRDVSAMVILPRHEVILRQLSLPGVLERDLAAAVQFQMDGLHPYEEDQVAVSWARLGDPSTVLVAIARREAVDRYATLFAEAGIKLAGFTCSAAAIYSALRLFGREPAAGILAAEAAPQGGAEVYGESPARPLFSAAFDVEPERAAPLAAAELRLEAVSDMVSLPQLLGADPALPYAAALASACPRLSLPLNLLPEEQRRSSSPLRWAPSAVLGALLVLLLLSMALFPRYENGRYLRTLSAEIAKLQPQAARGAEIDRQVELMRARIALLDNLRRRSKQDMDVLAEMTNLLTPPAWLSGLDLNRDQVMVSGQAEQAAPLLKLIDESPLFESSEFAAAPAPAKGGETFRVRTRRSEAAK
jgi:Tfp pilus assembly protein PilN